MPAEVEAAIALLPAVKEVKVVGRKSVYYGEEVTACIVLKPGTDWNEEEAREALRKKMAQYKVPSIFLIYDRLPRLASGKIPPFFK